MKNIEKGQSCTGQPGDIIKFAVGSVITTQGKKGLRMVMKAITLRTGKDGWLEEMDGSKLDLRKYTVQISRKAFESYLKYCAK